MASGYTLYPSERRAAFSLASIFSLRMLGLFMIYPVFALYAHKLPGATPFTIGLALGIYGLTQGLLQLPFGMLSDRIGRRHIIAVGLMLFAAGSIVAAMSHGIWGIIAGRALQGTGAVGAVILALMADLTREQQRTRAMAIIGMSIGLSFALAVVLGPVLDHFIHLSGIFWVMAVLAVIGVAVLYLLVPKAQQATLHRDTEAVPALLWKVCCNGQLLRLDFSIFALHAILMAAFLALPTLLREGGGVAHESALYFVVLLLAVVLMVPFIIYGEKQAQLKRVLLGGVIAIGLSQFLLATQVHALWLLGILLVVFFTAFNLLESILPSLVSRVAPAGLKGTAMGVYSSSQFMGIFIGGAVGGLVYQQFGVGAVFVFAGVIAVIWVLLVWGLDNPRLSSYTLALEEMATLPAEQIKQRLEQTKGVYAVALATEDHTALLKVNKNELDEAALLRMVKAP